MGSTPPLLAKFFLFFSELFSDRAILWRGRTTAGSAAEPAIGTPISQPWRRHGASCGNVTAPPSVGPAEPHASRRRWLSTRCSFGLRFIFRLHPLFPDRPGYQALAVLKAGRKDRASQQEHREGRLRRSFRQPAELDPSRIDHHHRSPAKSKRARRIHQAAPGRP